MYGLHPHRTYIDLHIIYRVATSYEKLGSHQTKYLTRSPFLNKHLIYRYILYRHSNLQDFNS